MTLRGYVVRVRCLLPDAAMTVDLHDFYATRWLDEGGLRMNFVSSVDGAATAGGLSKGLQTPGDNAIFGVLRDLADVVLVGAGTARDENYGPSKPSEARRQLRTSRGFEPVPPIAVVSHALNLDPASELFTAATAPTIVLTCASADAELRTQLAKVGDVAICGDENVDLSAALAALRDRGHTRILSEGGPRLFGEFAGAGLVDELCLSITPLLGGPGPRRIAGGVEWPEARGLELIGLLEEDGSLFARYRTS